MKKILLISTISFLCLMSKVSYAQFEKNTIEGLTNLEYKNIRSSWGDLNNDGYEDVILISNQEQSVRLLFNNGDGTFNENTTIDFVNRTEKFTNAIFADFDNDGFLDIFFTTSGITDPTNYEPNILYKNNGDETFTDVTEGDMATDASFSISASWGDANNDGYIDLYVSNISFHEGELNFFYINNGDGTFEKVNTGALVESQFATNTSHWIDINNDDFLDLIVLNNNSSNQVFINNQDNTFTEDTESILSGTSEDGSFKMTWLDLNLDGYFEPIIFNNSNNNQNKTYLNNADGTFSLISENSFPNTNYPSDIKTEDLNNDGFADLILSSTTEENYMFYGNSTNGFEQETNVNLSNGNAQASHIVTPDISNNGFLDIHFSMTGFEIENNEDDNDIFFENINNGNNWIRFHLQGNNSNRYGIGSKIALYHNNDIKGNQQIIADGFNKSNQYAHFGLNQIDRIDSAVISWPGEEKQIIKNLRPNLINTINQNEEYVLPTTPQFEFSESSSSTIKLNNIIVSEGMAVIEISSDGSDFQIVDTITNENEYLITGLDENTEYFIKAFSLTDMQFSDDSEILTVKTGINEPDLTETHASNNSIEIFWNDNTEFEDHYLIKLISDGIEEEFTAEKDSESYLIESLNENINYKIQVQAISDNGNQSDLSNELEVTTLLNPPSDLHAELTEGTINLIWQNNSDFNTGFELEKSNSTDFQNPEIIFVTNNEYQDEDISTNQSTPYFY
ncbi:MAG: FG-GAP-like repeat-containing protein [Bacteroidota bacterium]